MVVIENLGSPFYVAHGSIGNFEALHSMIPYTFTYHVSFIPSISLVIFKCFLAPMQRLVANNNKKWITIIQFVRNDYKIITHLNFCSFKLQINVISNLWTIRKLIDE